MKTFVLTAALVLISASAYAGTYNFEGVTVNLQDGCRSASCVTFGEGAQVPQGRNPVCFDHQNRCRSCRDDPGGGRNTGKIVRACADGGGSGKVTNRHSGESGMTPLGGKSR